MVLPMALYFHRAAVFALPANMVVIPVLAVLAPAAVATFAAALLSAWAALLPGAVTALLLHGVDAVIGRLSGLGAADVRVPGPAWWVALIAVAAWASCCWAVRRGRWGAWLTVAMLPLVALLVVLPERPVKTKDRLELTAIDVGQGDSLLVVGADGRTMLVDAGGPVGQRGSSEVTASYDIGEEVVSPYLWSRRLRRLDVVVLTHAHSDHMGGMPAVLRNFRPRELWVGIDPKSDAYVRLIEEAGLLGITVRRLHAGEAVAWGQTQIGVLAPAPGYGNAGAPKNDDSLVLRLDFGRGSVLLEGDAERPSEQGMLAAGRVRPVTVLKVGHHGSLTSTSEAFLAAAAPRDAVISVGRDNTFGHPRGEVIGRISASGVRLYRTDEFGLTTFLISRDGGVREIAGAR
jgi:competence protein ComEC